MSAPTLQPGYGPTLPELLAPRWRGLSPARRRVETLVGVLVAVLVIVGAVLFPRDGWVVHRSREVSFNLRYAQEMHRVPPRAGEYARVEGAGATLVLSPLHLPRYSGEVSGIEPLYAGDYITALAARTPGFQLQSEGKIRVNTWPGYSFTYAMGSGSRRLFTRVVLLTPALVNSRDGVTLTMTIPPNPVSDPTPDQIGLNDVLQEPLRSFLFGA